LREWDRINPGWMRSERKKDEYTRAVANTMRSIEDKEEKRLMKSIADAAKLDKTKQP
jgi:hypothetical protein